MVRPRKSTYSVYCIFIDTVCDGTIPAWHDLDGYPVVYTTEREAQREIVDTLQMKLQEFLDGDRDFADATHIEDFILPVKVWPNRSISTENGTTFGKRS